MALFGNKKTEEKKVKPAKTTKEVAVKPMRTSFVAVDTSIILRPHVTEKSGILSQNGVYTFQIAADTNKQAVARAILSLYKVNPVKIAIVNLPTRNVFVRGKRGTVAGVRKAIVTVKDGDKIDFV